MTLKDQQTESTYNKNEELTELQNYESYTEDSSYTIGGESLKINESDTIQIIPNKSQAPIYTKPFVSQSINQPDKKTGRRLKSKMATIFISFLGVYNVLVGIIYTTSAWNETDTVRFVGGLIGIPTFLIGIGLILRKSYARNIIILLCVISVIMSLPNVMVRGLVSTTGIAFVSSVLQIIFFNLTIVRRQFED